MALGLANWMAIGAHGGGVADTYAINGTSPTYILDFLNAYYRSGGSPVAIAAAADFARTGTAWELTTADAVQSVATGTPRIGAAVFDGYELANAGLQFEADGSANVCVSSDDLDGTGWSLTTCSFDAGVLTSAGGGFARYTSSALADNTNYTLTFDITSNSQGWIYLYIRNKASSNSTAFINTATGALGTTSGTATFSVARQDGVCKVTAVFGSGAGATTPFFQVQFATGNGSSGATAGATIGIRRVQIEADTIASSFMPTTGTAASRAAETLTTTHLSYSAAGVWGALRGTETYLDAGAANQVLLFDWRTDANNRITISLDTDDAKTGTLTLTSVVAGVSSSVSAAALTPGQHQRFDVSWRCDPASINIAVNGTAATEAAVAAIPDLSAATATFGGNGSRALFRAGTGVISDATLEYFGGKPHEIHAFLTIGQSNMEGRATYDSLGGHPEFVDQWTQAGAVADADIPLDYIDRAGFLTAMGPDITFATRYRLAHPEARVVFIPCAKGSTGFSDNNWNPGDTEYAAAVSRTLAYLAAAPTASLKGALCVMGENDAADSRTQEQFASDMDAMIAALRTALGLPNLPVAWGQIATFLAAGSFPTASQINAAIADLPNRVAHTAYSSSTGFTTSSDGVHFTTAADVRAIGERLYDAWASIT